MASWTPADEAELQRLKEQDRQLSEQMAGDPVAEAHVAHVAKSREGTLAGLVAGEVPEPKQAFSVWRGIIGGPIRDAVQGSINFFEDLGKSVRTVEQPIANLSHDVANGVRQAIHSLPAIGPVVGALENVPENAVTLPGLRGEEHAGTAEKLTRGFLSYLVPYTGAAKALGVMRAETLLGRMATGAAAGALTTFTTQDPVAGNMANLLKDTFGLDNATLNALTTEEDDNRLIARLKAATSDAVLGVATEALFEAGAAGIRAYRGVRGDAEEARALIETTRGDFKSKPVREAPNVDAEAGVNAPVPSTDPFDAAVHVAVKEQPKSWEDVLSFLKRHTGNDVNVDQEIIDKLAEVAHGDPENLLQRLGIDPTHLDWEQYANPEGARNLHKAIMDVYEKVAGRLGRTGRVVGEAEIVAGARSLASTAEVLKTLYGATSKLPEILMGARMFVGSHTAKLLSDAEEALAALSKGEGADEAWHSFLQTFHRHAFFLGSVRGAGSEIGRALKSLQFLARTDPKGATLGLKDVVEQGASKTVDEAAAKAAADDELNAVLQIDTDGEKIALLNTLLAKNGDIGELAQFVRGKSGSVLKRANDIGTETLGNLFSQATAAYNIKSGFSMLGLRAMGRWLATAARMGLAPFSRDMAMSARIAHAEAWAYTDGMISAMGDAIRNAVATVEREGASELFVNADNLGLKKLAKEAAKFQGKARAREGGINFERIDLDTKPRRFAFTSADRRELAEWVEKHSLPTLLQRGLLWFARTAGSVTNAAGTATRTGTILFINAPDQFVGSIAAKAGAQAFAARQAAIEAAEHGLEGKAFSDFMRARWTSLHSDVNGWHEQGMEQGFREAAAAAGQHEAREVLFQDPLELKSFRAMSKAHHDIPFANMVVAFMHTPLRILERTAIDYTPLGLFKDRVRRAIIAGGPQRDQALSQMSLGIMGMLLGYRLADDHDIIGNDGGFVSSARIDGLTSYSMKIGGDVYEFVRDDPVGTILGLGADLRTYINNNNDGPEAERNSLLLAEAAVWAFSANMLSKTWFESVANLVDAAKTGFGDQSFASAIRRWGNSQARRVTPGAAVQKSVAEFYDPWEREADTFFDNMLKVSLGAPMLPPSVDILGDPERKNEGERFIGLTWQPASTEPLLKELQRLSFPTPAPTKQIDGVRLNTVQIHRMKQLKGGEIRLEKFGGATMKEALEHLIELPEYKAMRKEAQIEQMRLIMKEYTKPAKMQLLQEDKELARRYLAQKLYTEGVKDNLTDEQIDAQTRQLGRELGLTK